MKKKFTFILASFLLCVTIASAQEKYEPTDKWPYSFGDFVEGTVFNAKGEQLAASKLNICLADGSLHFLDNDVIKKSDMWTVSTAFINGEGYVNVEGKMYKVLSQIDAGLVLTITEVDYDALGKAKIGYGVSSSTAQTQRNVSLLSEEMTFDILNMDTLAATERKGRGNVLPLKNRKYVYACKTLIPAKKADVVGHPALDKKKAQAFIKEQKIDFKDVASLEKLVVFLSENLYK